MSNSIFQSVIGQLREATDRVLGVIDTDGNVVSCTDPVLLGERWSEAALKVGSADGLVAFNGKVFKPIVGNSNFYEYAVFCGGEDELARGLCAIPGVTMKYSGEYFHEFVTVMPKAEEVLTTLENAGILGGLMVEDGILWCATEKVSREALDRAVSIVKEVLEA